MSRIHFGRVEPRRTATAYVRGPPADPARCRTAAIPDRTPFATTSALATQMIDAAQAAGAHAHWVTADEVYGQAGDLRAFPERPPWRSSFR
ncbi:hypothetical protein GCM10010156_58590 [Planobispora rosea]|uniref:Transposase IS701-like DDE domain-containing protein n=1 Tax=Planobispora rosea TaxID=35762 RepID=A0A8J3S737_PLARO|nr:transposase [Planobispora rosea]GGS92564.1 hypothetical protein GCM10010156_58590 [Planobispora rosea]GIH87162.1 hypothetical protein Pro02_55700 [Planobispora rosea]